MVAADLPIASGSTGFASVKASLPGGEPAAPDGSSCAAPLCLTDEGELPCCNKRLANWLGLELTDIGVPGMSLPAAAIEDVAPPDDRTAVYERPSMDCLIADADMPALDGFELRKISRPLRPRTEEESR